MQPPNAKWRTMKQIRLRSPSNPLHASARKDDADHAGRASLELGPRLGWSQLLAHPTRDGLGLAVAIHCPPRRYRVLRLGHRRLAPALRPPRLRRLSPPHGGLPPPRHRPRHRDLFRQPPRLGHSPAALDLR